MPASMEEKIIDILQLVLKHQDKPAQEITLEKPLYDEGLGLDSLCVAELSALLEKTFTKDPYTEGVLPETVADIVAFYGDGSA